MTINMSTAISNMRVLKNNGTKYSMNGSRTGTDGTADCSGAVYASLNKAGASLSIGNTDSLFVDLPQIGFSKTESTFKYGDIFIFGIQGQSSGSAGHTGIFLDSKQIIHCNYGANGVSIDNFNTVLKNAGNPPYTVYRNPETKEGEGDNSSQENTSKNMDNAGEIEEYSYIGDTLCIKGWHFSNSTPDNDSKPSGNDGENYNTDWNDIQSRAQFFVYVCLDLNIPKNTILALCANAYAESSIDPSAKQDYDASTGSQGNGYFQWSYPSNWGDVPNRMNRTYSDALYQISFAKSVKAQWINAGWGTWEEFWQGTQTPEYLTNAWVASWKRPKVIGNRWDTFINVVNVDNISFEKSKNKSISTFSVKSKNDKEIMQIFDATTDQLINSVNLEMKNRPDIKKENPDVEGIENCGIEFCMNFENENPFYVKFVRILGNGSTKTLDLSVIFFPHSSSRNNIGLDYSNECVFKIIITHKNGKNYFIDDMVKGISWTNKPQEIPSCSLEIPIHEVCKLDGNCDIKIIVFDKMFDGIVKGITLNTDNSTATIDVDHKISEWDTRQIPENYTVKNRNFPDVFSQSPFLYSTFWYLNCDNSSMKALINYAFSRQGHLEALNKACELTDNIWWRVGFRYDRYLEIGSFGETKNYIFSDYGNTERHINIISDVSIEKKFDHVFNALTVYGEKSDSSQASLTLRDVYLEQLQVGKPAIDGFPVVILNPTVNNEQKNFYSNITRIASNNSLEYSIIDEFSLNLEQGKIIEETKSFNDVAPFEQDGEPISDEERSRQSRIAYNAAVKILKNSGRRREEISFLVGYLPSEINVMDKIYFDLNNEILLYDGCSRYCRKVYESSSLFYITSIETMFDENLNETNKITICKELYKDD
ncbi:MAG: peptidoglycan hydrolase [Caudoviricetes sp.]|nr:MAG: peptidoglycan hydrolase [Caudoviricetes sp.]